MGLYKSKSSAIFLWNAARNIAGRLDSGQDVVIHFIPGKCIVAPYTANSKPSTPLTQIQLVTQGVKLTNIYNYRPELVSISNLQYR